MKNNKWMNGALPAIFVHISIGSVYAWSVLSKPIAEYFGMEKTVITWAFSLAIFFLGLSAAFLGKFITKIGAKKALFLSGLLFATGLCGAGFAVFIHNIWLLFIFYGVVGGIGIGIGYVAPIKPLMAWFHDKKGLGTGIAVMGFGFAAMVASPVMNFLILRFGIAGMFFIMAGTYLVLILLGAFLVKMPKTEEEHSENLEGKTLRQALSSREFYALWFIFFINILSGISLIPLISPMLQEGFGVSATLAATMVGIVAIFNGLGRITWASISDFTGRRLLFILLLFLQVFLFIGLSLSGSYLLFVVLLCVIVSCYGAGFACVPAYIADLFGPKNVTQILGCVLTAWSAAGVVGPIFTAWIRDTYGSYNSMFFILIGLLAVAGMVAFIPKTTKKPR